MCELREGKFIEKCAGVQMTLDPRKGFMVMNFVDTKTGKPTRDIMVLKAGEVREQGMALSYCPFTGKKIQTWEDEPEPEEDQS